MAKITEIGPSHTAGDEPEGWVLTGAWEGSVLDEDELESEESEEDKSESVPVDEPVVIRRADKSEPERAGTPPRNDSGRSTSPDDTKSDQKGKAGK